MKFKLFLLFPAWILCKIFYCFYPKIEIPGLKKWSKNALSFNYYFSVLIWCYILLLILFLIINLLIY